MLYGKYADGSIRKPRVIDDEIFTKEEWDEMMEEYRRSIFKKFGKEYTPRKEREDPKDE